MTKAEDFGVFASAESDVTRDVIDVAAEEKLQQQLMMVWLRNWIGVRLLHRSLERM